MLSPWLPPDSCYWINLQCCALLLFLEEDSNPENSWFPHNIPCLVDSSWSLRSSYLGKTWYVFSKAICVAPSSTMKPSQQEDFSSSVLPCFLCILQLPLWWMPSSIGLYHLILLSNQRKWRWSWIGYFCEHHLTNHKVVGMSSLVLRVWYSILSSICGI